MKYLLDTNILVDHLRGKKQIKLSYLQKGSAISIISQAELVYGAYKSQHPEKNLKKINKMIDDLNIEVVNLEKEIINYYGSLKAKLEKKGKRLDEFDILIASTALSENLTLATANIKHFQRITKLKLIKS